MFPDKPSPHLEQQLLRDDRVSLGKHTSSQRAAFPPNGQFFVFCFFSEGGKSFLQVDGISPGCTDAQQLLRTDNVTEGGWNSRSFVLDRVI